MQSVSAEFKQDRFREAVVLEQMQKENPILVIGISNAMLELGMNDRQVMKNMLTVVTMLYNCLRTQAEADAMNKGFTDD